MSSSWKSSAFFVANHNSGSGESLSTAVSSVQDSDSSDGDASAELTHPPHVNTSVGMSEFVSVVVSVLAWESVVGIWAGLRAALDGNLPSAASTWWSNWWSWWSNSTSSNDDSVVA